MHLAAQFLPLLATPVMYGESVSTVFPRRGAPDNLTASQQAGVQVAALGITLLFSLCGGVITGMIIKMPCLLPPAAKKPSCFTIGESSSRVYHYEDSNYWETPEEGEEEDNEDEKIHELEMLVRDIEMANARKAEIESELGNAGKSTDVNDVDVNDKVTSEAKE